VCGIEHTMYDRSGTVGQGTVLAARTGWWSLLKQD
jgi:hypothetical protein